MYQRFVTEKILAALQDTPVVMIAGPRQCGKTTLAKQLVSKDAFYITFDDTAQLEIAKMDPSGFIRNLPATQIILDEVQRVPELFVCIKQAVDENRKAGRFLLTGSSNALLQPRVSDSLAGRLEVINLFPLSECEIRGHHPHFLLSLLSQKAPQTKEIRLRNKLMEMIVRGNFPEPLSRATANRRNAWYTQYINSLIQKDLTEISNIEYLRILPQFVKTLALHAGQLVNFTKIGESVEISRQTVSKYLQLLEQLFLVEQLPAWHSNDGKKLTKAPKMHFVDTGLLCSLRHVTLEKLRKDLILFGHLLENYVFCELKKQASWLEQPIQFYHFRDKNQVEVDFVLEGPAGEIIGIEVKATATLKRKDFVGLEHLKELSGKNFSIGILLYDGDLTTSFGENLFAVPLGALWS